VITLGRSAKAQNVLASAEELARRGVAVHAASRGGDVTYHGPGQLVGYPILRLRGGVVAHVEAMARGLAALLASFGVEARWRRDTPGLWVGAPATPPAKICAFGVHVRHRVTMHGFALNVTTALDAFDLIVPCGLRDARVTSIAALTGAAPTPAELAPRAAAALGDAFGASFVRSSDALAR
jgi:lipoyl(octanoyl) transferase